MFDILAPATIRTGRSMHYDTSPASQGSPVPPRVQAGGTTASVGGAVLQSSSCILHFLQFSLMRYYLAAAVGIACAVVSAETSFAQTRAAPEPHPAEAAHIAALRAAGNTVGLDNLGCATSVTWQLQGNGDAFEHVAELSELKWLGLDHTHVEDADLAHLAGLTGLRSISMINAAITDEGLKHLANLDGLRAFNARNAKITDAGLKNMRLHAKTDLRLLWISQTQISDAGMDEIAPLVELRHLYLSETKVTDEGIKKLGKLSNLEYFYAKKLPLSDDGLATLKAAKNLTYLDLSHTKITDKSLDAIAQMSKIKTVWINESGITGEGLKKFRRNRPNVWISDTFESH
jgi:hypothetical protein